MDHKGVGVVDMEGGAWPIFEGIARHENTLTGRLDCIDWNFTKRRGTSPLEAVHSYPAKFIGDIPRSLIETIGLPPDSTVFDPFCGSGATLVESQRLGYASVGIDLNPIACLISRVKAAPVPKGIQKSWTEVIAEARSDSAPAGERIPNVNHWFTPDVRDAVGALVRAIRSHAAVEAHDFLFTALSSIIVKVSNQESDTRYAAISKAVFAHGVFEEFDISCARLEKALSSREYALMPCRVIEGDTLETTAQEIGRNVGLVITSPPYPNAYEYWLYYKYRMWWLGYDPLAVRSREIGARPHYFKKNHPTEIDFALQMERVFGVIRRVLVPGGHACFVVGRSKIHGRLIDNGALLCAAAARQHLQLVDQRDRVIQASRKSFNLSHPNIKKETLLVFRAS